MWFVFALLSVLFGGLHTFGQKVVVERGYNTYLLSALTTFFSCILGGLFFTLTSSWSLVPINLYWLALLSGFVFVIFTLTRFEALRFMDAAIFFPLYKVIGPAAAAGIGIFILKDVVTPSELIGIFLSCLVPILLISRIEHSRQKNLRLGLILLVVGTLFAAVSAAINSVALGGDSSLALPLLVIAHVFATVFGFSIYFHRVPKGTRKKEFKATCTNQFLLASFGVSVLQFLSFYTFLLALSGGNLSLVYSINAHYIVIPVVLSVILYKEHWNVRKALALVISMLALILLHR